VKGGRLLPPAATCCFWSHLSKAWAAGEALLEEDAKVQGLKEEAVVGGGSW